jgi:predicted oxidoreductase (fatty acid repression mutant protein)
MGSYSYSLVISASWTVFAHQGLGREFNNEPIHNRMNPKSKVPEQWTLNCIEKNEFVLSQVKFDWLEI